MKKLLFYNSREVMISLFVVSCALFEKPPLLKTVTVDATLAKIGEVIYMRMLLMILNGRLGTGNPQSWYSFDANNIYIAGEFTKEGLNNFMVMVDLSGVTGAADTSKHPWGRSYKFEKGDVDFVIETWGDGYAAWRFTSQEATEVTGTLKSAEVDGKKRMGPFHYQNLG
ncbi:MAG: hypothetical protein ABDH59_05940 [Fervidobacterium sp.]